MIFIKLGIILVSIFLVVLGIQSSIIKLVNYILTITIKSKGEINLQAEGILISLGIFGLIIQSILF